jgi:uncharacterized protein YjeT (DUF2065 family)
MLSAREISGLLVLYGIGHDLLPRASAGLPKSMTIVPDAFLRRAFLSVNKNPSVHEIPVEP